MTLSLNQLGDLLLQDPLTNVNNAALLLAAIRPDCEADDTCAALLALQVFFSDACERKQLARPALALAQGSTEAAYQQWLVRQYAAFLERLLGLISSGAPPAVQVHALAALMDLVRGERPGEFAAPTYARALETLLRARRAAPDALAALVNKYLSYADVRYHTLRVLAKVAGRSRSDVAASSDSDAGDGAGDSKADVVSDADLARNVHDVLTAISPALPGAGDLSKPDLAPGAQEVPVLASWCGAAEAGNATAAGDSGEGARRRRKRRRQEGVAEGLGVKVVGSEAGSKRGVRWASQALQRRAWSGAWLALLRMPLPDDVFRKVLVRLHADVLPHLVSPLLLTSFLTDALDRGGLNGMLALHGIFTLVTRHGLEYPRFYERFYQLLTPAAFQARQRARFFELADVFLSSGLVPAYTVAAFAKRFARLALTAPPAGALIAIAFVHNLLRRHPACGVLLHRLPRPAPAAASPKPEAINSTSAHHDTDGRSSEGAKAAAEEAAGVDVYLDTAADPAHSRAIESSLWELDSLRNHYCPQVAAMVGVLDKDLSDRRRTAEIDLAPLLGGSYASLARAELARKVKRVPTAFYAERPRRLLDANCAADFVGWAI